MAMISKNETKKSIGTPASVAPKSDIKKTETKTEVKAEVKAPVKAEPKKEVAPAKAEPKKEAAAPAKAEPKKAAAKKKTTRKTTTKRKAKAPEEKVIDLHVQFGGKEVSYMELVARVKAIWKEQGKRESSMKSLNIYVKPEEYKAYYVINGKITGELEF